jgi:hypothetical protein
MTQLDAETIARVIREKVGRYADSLAQQTTMALSIQEAARAILALLPAPVEPQDGPTHAEVALKNGMALLAAEARIAELERARDTLASVVQSMTSACVMVREIASPTIRLGNGKETAIEMRDGERGWLLHDDGIVMLQTAEQAGVSTLAALASAQTGTATTEAGHD